MTFTNEELLNAVNALSALNSTGKFGFAVAKNLRRMRADAQDYIQYKDDLLLKYGVPVEGEPGRYKVSPEKAVEYNKEVSSMGKETVNIEVFQVDEQTFLDQGFDSNQMVNLVWMVKEDE